MHFAKITNKSKSLKIMINNQDKLIQAVIENLKAKLAYIANASETMEVLTLGYTQLIDSGLPADTFNAAYGGIVDERSVKAVADYYEQRSYPFAWWFEQSELCSGKSELLRSAGMEFDEDNIAMVCDLEASFNLPDIETELVIKLCTDGEDFQVFGDLISSLFNPKEDNVQLYYDRLSDLSKEDLKDLELFVGYVDGQPVSTAALFKTKVAGFYDISTKEDMRRKGYGAQMLKHAMSHAYKQGFTTGILQASPDGLGIYRNVGFKDIGVFQVWNKTSNFS